MLIDKKQKITILISSVLVVIVFAAWLISGAEIFTKTKVLVEVKDELFNTTYNEWRDQFVLGLDLTLVISAVVIILTLILLFIFNKRRRKNEASN